MTKLSKLSTVLSTSRCAQLWASATAIVCNRLLYNLVPMCMYTPQYSYLSMSPAWQTMKGSVLWCKNITCLSAQCLKHLTSMRAASSVKPALTTTNQACRQRHHRLTTCWFELASMVLAERGCMQTHKVHRVTCAATMPTRVHSEFTVMKLALHAAQAYNHPGLQTAAQLMIQPILHS